MYSERVLHKKVEAAIRAFFDADRELLCVNASERSLSHKLAEHLQCQFQDLKVDCEYNRHRDDIKSLGLLEDCRSSTNRGPNDLHPPTVLPDIVVHERRSDNRNTLVIEVKKTNNPDGPDCDVAKLREFTNKTPFGYKVGLFLLFDVRTMCISCVRCFQNGCEKRSSIWADLEGLGYERHDK